MRTLLNTARPAPLTLFACMGRITATFLLGFILPRLVGIESFGHYRVFALFLIYVGLVHFGFIDGVYFALKKARGQIPKERPLLWAAVVFLLEILVAMVFFALALFFFEGGMRAVFLALFAMAFPELTGRYLENMQAALHEKDRDTPFRLLSSLLVIAVVGLVHVFGIEDHQTLLAMLVASAYLVMFARLVTYRRLVFKKVSHPSHTHPGVVQLVKQGFPVLVVYSLPLLFVAFSMHAVFVFGSVEKMAIHGFAANMLVFAAISVSTATKKLEKGTERLFMYAEREGLSLFKGVVALFTLVGAACYYALLWTVPRYLFAFEASLPLWRVFLGLLVFSCTIGTAHFLYCRFKGKSSLYVSSGVFFLFLTSLAGMAVMWAYGDLRLLAWTLFFGFFLWYLVLETVLSWREKTPWRKNNLFAFGGLTLYILVTALFPHFFAAFLYAAIIIGLFLIFYREELRSLKTHLSFFQETK